ncbi:uncharacterized protein LOC114538503 [Dendronephthya gigantea]|uniref:uncharacterized protein LOC114538503 n=1 Tax=Dendronephthya gigantea TaxID=151771 RepID=UPI00106ACD68|nr:uncharacterized protein LOC114538503 [Dendronephthya gigantea]
MYCPVYGCNSSSKTDSGIHFFSFPSGKSVDQQYRRKAWIEFCKRKYFSPSSCTRICSLHFNEDAYEPGNSPQFLQRIECKEKFSVRLKRDALPTLNKPLADSNQPKSIKTREHTLRRQRKKGILEMCSEGQPSTSKEQASTSDEQSGEELDVQQREQEDAPISMTCTASTQTTEALNPPHTSSKSTQTTIMSNSVKTQTVMDATSTFFQTTTKPQMISTPTQTISDASSTTLNIQPNQESLQNQAQLDEATQLKSTYDTIETSVHPEEYSSSISEVSSKEEEYVPGKETSNETESTDEEEPDQRRVLLRPGKLPEEQIKLIVFEDSIMQVFGKCWKCGANCTVAIESQIGSFCNVISSCCVEENHIQKWTTGPTNNCMPIFHLLLASGILATGLESSKVLRLFSALRIPNVKQRELSNILKCYVIPSVLKFGKRNKLRS